MIKRGDWTQTTLVATSPTNQITVAHLREIVRQLDEVNAPSTVEVIAGSNPDTRRLTSLAVHIVQTKGLEEVPDTLHT